MRLASKADFEGGALYTNYRRFPMFGWRAAWLTARYGTAGKWLVAGCGWGYLVDELVALGVDAWGIDASSYAVSKAQEAGTLAPGVGNRVVLIDATNRSQLASLRSTAGLSGSQRFTVIVTEDILPVLTDSEASAVAAEARRVGTNICHVLTALRPDEDAAASIAAGMRVSGLNWKTLAQWKTLAGVDTVLNAEGFAPNPDGGFYAEVL